MIARETTDDSADHSQPGANVRRPSTSKRNACAREATCHDAADKSERSSAVRSIRQLIKMISVMANRLRIITAGSEPMRDSGRASMSQPRYTAPATAAGGVSERNPAKSPIRNANNSVKSVMSELVRNVLSARFRKLLQCLWKVFIGDIWVVKLSASPGGRAR